MISDPERRQVRHPLMIQPLVRERGLHDTVRTPADLFPIDAAAAQSAKSHALGLGDVRL